MNREIKAGVCGASNTLRVARAALHFWEEPIISGTNGSGTVFFSFCPLKCIYCQNYTISSEGVGKDITIERLAEIFKELEEQGAHNINLVSPTHYVLQIIEALKIYKPKIPIVYNTSGYETRKTLQLLKPWIDVFLTDIKYFNPELSQKLSLAKDYFTVASQAAIYMRENTGPDVIENGIMKKGVIIRHLVLPGHTSDTIYILNWVKEKLGSNTIVSLMSQYTPCYKATYKKELNRPITKMEYTRVLTHVKNLGFVNGFVQEASSSDTAFIPPFNNEGV